MNIVDRRPNPKGKSLSNRQRFLGRARVEVKSAVQEALRKRKVADVEHGEKVAIPTRGHHRADLPSQPPHRQAPTTSCRATRNSSAATRSRGRRAAKAAAAREGSPDGSGEDAFEFTLTREEFLDLFFEDLELPDLVKKSLKDTTAVDLQRAGYTVTGTPSNLSVPRTMRNSMARRIALRRPKLAEIEALEARARMEERAAPARRESAELRRSARTESTRRSKIIPYIDPIDVRYRRYERVPKPNTEAVMFCLMDVSGSMTEAMKDLAKRFFMLLHVFLVRRYRHVDVVFIRHTSRRKRSTRRRFSTAARPAAPLCRPRSTR